jgi:phosphopantetheine--protein transferase-like protein
MIKGIGADLMDASRLEYLRGNYDDPFIKKVYTAAERDAALAHPDPVLYLAGRFTAKEAVIKALGLIPGRVSFKEIETLNQTDGQPFVALTGKTAEFAEGAGVSRIFLSLSNDANMILSFAVCESE